MSAQVVTQKLLVFLLSLAALTQTGGCSKAVIEANGQAPTETSRIARDRVVEIDRLLSAPLTGTPEDSDRRASLRAERVGLTGVADPAQLMRSQPAVARVANEPPRNTSIVVAHDSRGNHEPHRLSGVEAMTPSERKRYYEELRLRNTRVVVPVVVDGRY